MRSRTKIVRNMLAAAVILLLPVYLHSCAASRKTKAQDDSPPLSDSTKIFEPLHPPVVVGKTWREAMN